MSDHPQDPRDFEPYGIPVPRELPKPEAQTNNATSLGHLPGEKWAFDEKVAGCFGDMLERSIPQLSVMREAVTALAGRFVQKCSYGVVIDLGASGGDALAPIARNFPRIECLALETAPAMLTELRKRWPFRSEEQRVEVRNFDLRIDQLPKSCVGSSVVLSVLTLQFVPIEHRQRIVRDVWKNLAPGGAFILVEKILGATADVDEMMVEEYLGLKGENGYSQEEIARKRLALEGVLVPLTAKMNEDLLRAAGFVEVDAFWRWMNFCGWLAIKEAR